MNYTEAEEYIRSLSSYGMVPGLDTIKELCRRMGNPQDSLRFVHVAGTNGKGSVSAYLSSILKCGGYRVGRFLSPAVMEYREIIRVNERPITKKAMCEGLSLLRSICEGMKEEGRPHPTPFEVETALGFWYFRSMGCDIVVLETGMGGLLDATNVITSVVAAVFTSISMDHMKFLGESLEEIAGQKAGIIKKGCRVVTMAQRKEAMEILRREAKEKECVLTLADVDSAKRIRYGIERQRFDFGGYKDLEIRLAGRHQIANGVLSVCVSQVLGECGFPVEEKALRKGLLQTVWPGRFTVLGKKPWFIADGAHNAQAAAELAKSLQYYFPNRRMIFIVGIFRDKEYKKIMELTHGLADQIITITPPNQERALSAYELAGEIVGLHPNVTAADSLEEAVEMSRLLAGREDVIVAFGSLSYMGKLIKLAEAKNKEHKRGGGRRQQEGLSAK